MTKFYIDIDKLTPEYRQRLYQSLEDKQDELKKEIEILKNEWTVIGSFMENPKSGNRYEIGVRKVK